MLNAQSMGKIYIGTSGWQYKGWKGILYPEGVPQKDWLRYYTKHFNTVEVNSSFYRQTKASTFKKWEEEVGPDFTFSVKGVRFITHIKRLKDVEDSLKIFFDNVGVLVSKSKRQGKSIKHVILWQLPPSFKKDTERLKKFLDSLPKDFQHAFEFRHESWMDASVFTTLLVPRPGRGVKLRLRRDVVCTPVIQDWKAWPRLLDDREIYERCKKWIDKFPFIYIRFHGAKQLYASNYGEGELKEWAEKIKKWKKKYDVYVYFNNDAGGYAPKNALRLKELSE